MPSTFTNCSYKVSATKQLTRALKKAIPARLRVDLKTEDRVFLKINKNALSGDQTCAPKNIGNAVIKKHKLKDIFERTNPDQPIDAAALETQHNAMNTILRNSLKQYGHNSASVSKVKQMIYEAFEKEITSSSALNDPEGTVEMNDKNPAHTNIRRQTSQALSESDDDSDTTSRADSQELPKEHEKAPRVSEPKTEKSQPGAISALSKSLGTLFPLPNIDKGGKENLNDSHLPHAVYRSELKIDNLINDIGDPQTFHMPPVGALNTDCVMEITPIGEREIKSLNDETCPTYRFLLHNGYEMQEFYAATDDQTLRNFVEKLKNIKQTQNTDSITDAGWKDFLCDALEKSGDNNGEENVKILRYKDLAPKNLLDSFRRAFTHGIPRLVNERENIKRVNQLFNKFTEISEQEKSLLAPAAFRILKSGDQKAIEQLYHSTINFIVGKAKPASLEEHQRIRQYLANRLPNYIF